MNDTIIYYKLQQTSDYIERICAILLLKRRSKNNRIQKIKKNEEKTRKLKINPENEGQMNEFDLF